MIYELDKEIAGFPDPRNGESGGLFAIGGDLSKERVELAYAYGILPWFPYKPEDNDILDENGKPYIQWYCPMDRFVLLPGDIHVSHSMRQLLCKVHCDYPFSHPLGNKVQDGFMKYVVTFNRDFEHVIENCGKLRENEVGAWLGPEIKQVFTQLHEDRKVCSIEVWQFGSEAGQGGLVGGLYGYCGVNYFCGESMFSLVPSASKIALITLAANMEKLGIKMIDLQFETDHLRSMGGRYITYKEYLSIIYGEDHLPLEF